MSDDHGLFAALSRVHQLIEEMREDGISKYAIFGALAQAISETARGMNSTASDRAALADVVSDGIKRP